MAAGERVAARTCASRSPTRSCASKVTPDYTLGCKRIVPSNRWYRALPRPTSSW